jgi:hypothetical protein
MENTFDRILENSSLNKLIFTYIHKHNRTGICYVVYKELDNYKVIDETEINELPSTTIGIIDRGMFLPIKE